MDCKRILSGGITPTLAKIKRGLQLAQQEHEACLGVSIVLLPHPHQTRYPSPSMHSFHIVHAHHGRVAFAILKVLVVVSVSNQLGLDMSGYLGAILNWGQAWLNKES
jgi:hypothetical protein